jgi:ribulose-phosphate 3-epimerase
MLITPSLLAYHDWVEFKSLLRDLESHPIDGLHIDVMDGHFVPNLAFGPDLVGSIAKHTTHPLDIHLMINCLDTMLKRYVDLSPRVIFFHPEACDNIPLVIELIHSAGVQVGFAIHPGYPIEKTKPFWHVLDRLLIMTVYPGFSGQTMIAQHLEKVKWVKQEGFQGLCFVDGGVTREKFPELQAYQVDGVVMGNSYFQVALKS